MSTEKISLSLDASRLTEARQGARDGSLSAYGNKGLQRRILADRRRDLLDDWEEFGPISAEALAEMRALWPD